MAKASRLYTNISLYFQLVKPGIIFGNAITATAGYFLASKGHVNYEAYAVTLLGFSCVIASACVLNNYIDRDIDKKMIRTKNRALAIGSVSHIHALVYTVILGFVGIFILLLHTNLLTSCIAIIGYYMYVIVYGFWKRKSIHGTLVGSVSGAIPPVVGYTAVSNKIDAEALLLFFLLVIWQIPHFYAIAIYRLEEYKAAGIPVFPIKMGVSTTKVYMFLYVIAFSALSLVPTLLGLTGMLYFIAAIISGTIWILLSLQGFQTTHSKKWARKMFFTSLIIISVLCLILSVDVKIY